MWFARRPWRVALALTLSWGLTGWPMLVTRCWEAFGLLTGCVLALAVFAWLRPHHSGC